MRAHNINITHKFELSLTFARLMFRMGHRRDLQTSVLFKRGWGVNTLVSTFLYFINMYLLSFVNISHFSVNHFCQ